MYQTDNSKHHKSATSLTSKQPRYLTQAQRFVQEHLAEEIKRSPAAPQSISVTSSPMSSTLPSRDYFQGSRVETTPSKAQPSSAGLAPKAGLKNHYANIQSNQLSRQKSANQFKPNHLEEKDYWGKGNLALTPTKSRNETLQVQAGRPIKTEVCNTVEYWNEVEETRKLDGTPKKTNAQALSKPGSSKEEGKKMIKSGSVDKMLTAKDLQAKSRPQTQQHHKYSNTESHYRQISTEKSSPKLDSQNKIVRVKENEMRADPLDLPEKTENSIYERLATCGATFYQQEDIYKREKTQETLNTTGDLTIKKAYSELDNQNNQQYKLEELEKQKEIDKQIIKELQEQILKLKVHLQNQKPNKTAENELSKGLLETREQSLTSTPEHNKESLEKEIQLLRSQNQLMTITIETLRSENLTLKQSNKHLLQFKEAARRYRDLAQVKQEECAILAQELLRYRSDLTPRMQNNLVKSASVSTPTLSKNKSDSDLLNKVPESLQLLSSVSENEKVNGVFGSSGGQNGRNEKTLSPEKLGVSPFASAKTFQQIHV